MVRKTGPRSVGSFLVDSIRLIGVLAIITVIVYPILILAVGQVAVPASAQGSLIERDGEIVGSARIAQSFTRPEYLWPRPSAVGYDGAGAGGSNLAPTNPALGERAEETVMAYRNSGIGIDLPADLVTASGSGLDPHISLEGALVQTSRIASARNVDLTEVESVIRAAAQRLPPALVADEQIVAVLQANLALDDHFGRIPNE